MKEISYEYDKLKDFNSVFMWYAKQLIIINHMKPMGRSRVLINKINPTFARDRAMINNVGVNIAQNFDHIERNCTKSIDKLILEEIKMPGETEVEYSNPLLNRMVDNFEIAFKKLMKDNHLTPFETLKQIRNAFLHGNYKITAKADLGKIKVKPLGSKDSEDKLIEMNVNRTIHLHSTKMDGSLPYDETIAFIDLLFYNIRSRCTKENKEFYTVDPRYMYCQSEYALRKYLNSMQVYRIISKGKKENGNLAELIKKHPTIKTQLEIMHKVDGTNFFELEEIPEEEMKKRRKTIERFIRHVGKKNWKYVWEFGMHDDIYDNILSARFKGNVTTISLANCCARAFEMLENSHRDGTKMSDTTYKELVKVSFQTPLIYSDMLLGLLNYGCGYLKANNAEENNIFEYHNLEGMDGIIPSIDTDKTKSIIYGASGAEKQRKIDLSIEGYRKQLENINASIRKTKKLIEGLNNRNPNRKTMEQKFKESLKNSIDKKEEVIKQIFKLSIRRDEYNQDYTDCSELFRHLRNSIAHGTYEINYDKALKKKNLEQTEITFIDYKEDDIERTNPVFKLELNAKQIIMIMESVMTRVNKQLMQEDQTERIAATKIHDVMKSEGIGYGEQKEKKESPEL